MWVRLNTNIKRSVKRKPVLNVVLFWTSDSGDEDGAIAQACVHSARVMLKSVGLDINAVPGSKNTNHVMPLVAGPPFGVGELGSVLAMNAACDFHLRGPSFVVDPAWNRLPIIFSRLPMANASDTGQMVPISGHTVRSMPDDPFPSIRPWWPYCVIYPWTAAIVGHQTMLHEMGHAAGATHDLTTPDDLMSPIRRASFAPSAATVDSWKASYFYW